MTNHVIDNSISNLGKVVLWQYDRAIRLLSLLKHLQVMFVCSVQRFWDMWRVKVLSIDTCNSFGLSVWGSLIGVSPPTIVDSTGTTRFISNNIYRKLIKGKFHLQRSDSSYEGILQYLEIVFGVDGSNNLTKWMASVSEYGWTTNVDELNFKYKPNKAYPKDFVFWYDPSGKGDETNWICTENISKSENTSFKDLLDDGKITQTAAYPTGSTDEDTIYLHLIDPEGYIRKIAAGPRGALRIDLSYKYGDYTITASVTRMQKCGVSIIDEGNMALKYVKTPYYDQMHTDQKYLFEQRQDDVCVYPIGVRTNEPDELWLFGFDGQQPLPEDEYKTGVAYSKGTVVWTLDTTATDYHGMHWKFTRDVSAQENTSFSAIREAVVATDEGDPFVSGIVDDEACDLPAPNGLREGNEEKIMRETYLRYAAQGASSLILNVDGQSMLGSSDSNNLPREYKTTDGFVWQGIVDGFVLPIQMEVWQKAIADSISNGKISSVVFGDGVPESLQNRWLSTRKEFPIAAVSYDRGEARVGAYYRKGCTIRINGEPRFVSEGGTYMGPEFRDTNTVTPDRSVLKEHF